MGKLLKSKKLLSLIVILGLFFVISQTMALEIDWPESPGRTRLTDDSDLGDMVKYFYEWAIVLGGLAVFFSLLMAGFKYLSSMGNPSLMKESMDQIRSAFFGLVLLLSSWLILNTINPDLTTFRKSSYDFSGFDPESFNMSLEQMPSCDYAVLYAQTEFGGSPIVIPAKTSNLTLLEKTDGIKMLVNPSGTGIKPLSIKSFSNGMLDNPSCLNPPCECNPHACGCTLQLFSHTTDESGTFVPCGYKVGDVNAWDDDLQRWEEPSHQIDCVRLVGKSCNPCRIVTADGNCTSNATPDSNWGDNLYNCVGDNDDENNKRCYNGKCVKCGGFVYADGCGGCSFMTNITSDLPTSVRGVIDAGDGGGGGGGGVVVPVAHSNLACWHTDKVDGGGSTCNGICQNYGGCVPAEWDDISWLVCAHFYRSSIKGILKTGLSNAPIFNNAGWVGICFNRLTAIQQDCGAIGGPWGYRLCVCRY